MSTTPKFINSLTQLEKSEEQIDEMRQLIDQLNAIEQRVAERQAMTASGESKDGQKADLKVFWRDLNTRPGREVQMRLHGYCATL